MKQAVLGFIAGVAVASVVSYGYNRSALSPLLDMTVQGNLTEQILNADQIRDGNADQTLERLDNWLRGDQIKKSIGMFVTNEEREAEMFKMIDEYRERAGVAN